MLGWWTLLMLLSCQRLLTVNHSQELGPEGMGGAGLPAGARKRTQPHFLSSHAAADGTLV